MLTFDDKDTGFGCQDESVVGPRIAANDLVVKVGIEALRFPWLHQTPDVIG